MRSTRLPDFLAVIGIIACTSCRPVAAPAAAPRAQSRAFDVSVDFPRVLHRGETFTFGVTAVPVRSVPQAGITLHVPYGFIDDQPTIISFSGMQPHATAPYFEDPRGNWSVSMLASDVGPTNAVRFAARARVRRDAELGDVTMSIDVYADRATQAVGETLTRVVTIAR